MMNWATVMKLRHGMLWNALYLQYTVPRGSASFGPPQTGTQYCAEPAFERNCFLNLECRGSVVCGAAIPMAVLLGRLDNVTLPAACRLVVANLTGEYVKMRAQLQKFPQLSAQRCSQWHVSTEWYEGGINDLAPIQPPPEETRRSSQFREVCAGSFRNVTATPGRQAVLCTSIRMQPYKTSKHRAVPVNLTADDVAGVADTDDQVMGPHGRQKAKPVGRASTV